MAQPGFHVFSIESPTDQKPTHTKPYVTRRTHHKSRMGCSRCKEKRVRCDEIKPSCTRCARRMLSCEYDTTGKRIGSDTSECPSIPSSQASQSPEAFIDSPDLLGEPSKCLVKSSKKLQLLKHYDVITSNALLVGPEPRKYHDMILCLAQDHSYLSHALMSIAALHLTAANIDGFAHSRLEHLSLALQEFQNAIAKPIAYRDSDALVITAMMINILWFTSFDEVSASDSWVWSSDPQRLSWLSVQQGQGAILAQTRPFHCASGLLAHFTVNRKHAMGESSRRLPREMFDLCEVSSDMGPRGVHPNPYHDLVHTLALLMPLEPGINSLIKYMHFCARIYPPFIALVEQNDHRALLILSYWFALMISVGDLWWCRNRVRRDCLAICILLDAEGDDEVRKLLQFPAAACGYYDDAECTSPDGRRGLLAIEHKL